MPLKKSKGNMLYPWVTHTHTHLGGEYPHKCVYCYVDNPRFGRPERYAGPLRLIEDEFKVNYGEGKTIFIEHMNDLFAADMPREFINRIIGHCCEWPDNTFVFQTKNPRAYLKFVALFPRCRPCCIFGTTIETNRIIPNISHAPTTFDRMDAMVELRGEHPSFRRFVTIEPVLDFDVDILAGWIAAINPEFLNLGADSKNRNLPEPTVEKIMALVARLHEYGIELREKRNLDRLLVNSGEGA